MSLSSRGRRGAPAAALLTAVLLAAPVNAQTTAQSTLGPGGTFDLGTSYVIGADAPGVNLNREVATAFTYGGPNGFELFDLGLALRNALTPSLPVLYSISFRQGSDFATSTQLESWNIGSNLTSPAVELRRFEFAPGIALMSGETYWIHVSGNIFAESVGGWALSDPALPSSPGTLLRNDDNLGAWTDWDSPLPAYEVRVTGAPVGVPEPALASLLLVAAAPLAWRARRRGGRPTP